AACEGHRAAGQQHLQRLAHGRRLDRQVGEEDIRLAIEPADRTFLVLLLQKRLNDLARTAASKVQWRRLLRELQQLSQASIGSSDKDWLIRTTPRLQCSHLSPGTRAKAITCRFWVFNLGLTPPSSCA